MLNEQFLRGDKEKKTAIEIESTKSLQRRQQLLGNSGRQWRRLTAWYPTTTKNHISILRVI